MLCKQEQSIEKCSGTVRPDDFVYMKSYAWDSKWVPGVIIVSYKVKTGDGQVHRWNVDQLLDRVAFSVDSSRPEPGVYIRSILEPDVLKLPPPTIEVDNPGVDLAGAEGMTEPSLPPRSYACSLVSLFLCVARHMMF